MVSLLFGVPRSRLRRLRRFAVLDSAFVAEVTKSRKLSPPPIRRANPTAKMTPGVSVIAVFTLAFVTRGFFLDVFEILVVDDALLA